MTPLKPPQVRSCPKLDGVCDNSSLCWRVQLTNSMRRVSIIPAILILVLASSAFACVTGWRSEPADFCSRRETRQASLRKKSGTGQFKARECGTFFKSLPSRCGMRTFVHLQLAELRRSDIRTPLPLAGKSWPNLKSSIISFSIGRQTPLAGLRSPKNQSL